MEAQKSSSLNCLKETKAISIIEDFGKLVGICIYSILRALNCVKSKNNSCECMITYIYALAHALQEASPKRVSKKVEDEKRCRNFEFAYYCYYYTNLYYR